MKNFQFSLFVFLAFILLLPTSIVAQDTASDVLQYEVNRMLPFVLVSRQELQEAQSLNDINDRFEADWVKDYISVEISATHKGALVKVVGDCDKLSLAQKSLMSNADSGTPISVQVQYMPENNLSINEPKVLNFTFTTEPEVPATYPGGMGVLKKYLNTVAMAKIPSSSFQDYDLTAVRFTIDKKGEIVDAYIFGAEYQKDRDLEIDGLLLKTISEMPCWQPAIYADGTQVSQEFVLTVGNLENCIVPMLNIKKDL